MSRLMLCDSCALLLLLLLLFVCMFAVLQSLHGSFPPPLTEYDGRLTCWLRWTNASRLNATEKGNGHVAAIAATLLHWEADAISLAAIAFQEMMCVALARATLITLNSLIPLKWQQCIALVADPSLQRIHFILLIDPPYSTALFANAFGLSPFRCITQFRETPLDFHIIFTIVQFSVGANEICCFFASTSIKMLYRHSAKHFILN